MEAKPANQRIYSGMTHESTDKEVSQMMQNFNTKSVKTLLQKEEDSVRNFHLPKISNASSP